MNRTSTPARASAKSKQKLKQSKLKKQQKRPQSRSLSTTASKSTSTPLSKSQLFKPLQIQPLSFQKRKFSQQYPDAVAVPEVVDFQEEPVAEDFQAADEQQGSWSDREQESEDSEELGFIKEENARSFHPPMFAARPLKVNIANIFDPRSDYQGACHDFEIRFEIDHLGNNVDEDLDEKASWVDSHITNDWLDTCMDRYCVPFSKRAKQQKPSNSRQAKARKMHKQTGEKALANSIRLAIDNTPRFTGFANQLAENKQTYGVYDPTPIELEIYQASGLARDDFLRHAGKDFKSRRNYLNQFRETAKNKYNV